MTTKNTPVAAMLVTRCSNVARSVMPIASAATRICASASSSSAWTSLGSDLAGRHRALRARCGARELLRELVCLAQQRLRLEVQLELRDGGHRQPRAVVERAAPCARARARARRRPGSRARTRRHCPAPAPRRRAAAPAPRSAGRSAASLRESSCSFSPSKSERVAVFQRDFAERRVEVGVWDRAGRREDCG